MAQDIIRIVRMEFRVEEIAAFEAIFERSKHAIRRVEGCKYLAMNQDASQPHVRYTYSIWESEAALEKYRQSELFQTTWAATKVLFAAKAQAFSLKQLEIV
jgi:quinol monooxygenase YgiN